MSDKKNPQVEQVMDTPMAPTVQALYDAQSEYIIQQMSKEEEKQREIDAIKARLKNLEDMEKKYNELYNKNKQLVLENQHLRERTQMCDKELQVFESFEHNAQMSKNEFVFLLIPHTSNPEKSRARFKVYINKCFKHVFEKDNNRNQIICEKNLGDAYYYKTKFKCVLDIKFIKKDAEFGYPPMQFFQIEKKFVFEMYGYISERKLDDYYYTKKTKLSQQDYDPKDIEELEELNKKRREEEAKAKKEKEKKEQEEAKAKQEKEKKEQEAFLNDPEVFAAVVSQFKEDNPPGNENIKDKKIEQKDIKNNENTKPKNKEVANNGDAENKEDANHEDTENKKKKDQKEKEDTQITGRKTNRNNSNSPKKNNKRGKK